MAWGGSSRFVCFSLLLLLLTYGIVFAASGCGNSTTESGAAQPSVGGSSGSADAGSADAASDPFAAAPTCTSGLVWMRANHGSAEMNPGRACIDCHATMHGPSLTIAGTVYPTAHEPDMCDGADGAGGVVVTIVDAAGQTLTLSPNVAGNFRSEAPLSPPYEATISFMGRERTMGVMQTSGDCNGCHTQTGANGAPGRILLP
jgi:hypothetical protein